MTTDTRPNPLGEVASKVGVAWASASGLVTGAVTYGLLTTAQGDAITAAGAAAQDTVTALGTVVAVVLPLIGAVISSFRTAAAGRDHVTPITSPRDNDGNPLTPDVAPAIGEHRLER